MDEKEIRSLIQDWYVVSKQQRPGSVSNFVFLWICFNARMAFESGKFRDRDMLEWLKKARHGSELRRSYDQVMAPLESNFRNDLRTLAGQGAISDPRGGKHPDVIVSGPEDFPNIVEAVYRVRCNLFHGRKRPNDLRDRKLVALCSRILNKWLGSMVASWSRGH
ncbi:MAG: hypothetical protein ACRDHO_05700 [Actinomycetota bacterium]